VNLLKEIKKTIAAGPKSQFSKIMQVDYSGVDYFLDICEENAEYII